MPAHNVLEELFRAAHDANGVDDPGDGESIAVTIDRGVCHLRSGAEAETRTLPVPTAAGLELLIAMITDGAGDITLTVTGGYDAAGNTDIVFADADQDWVLFRSIQTAANTFRWRVLDAEGVNVPSTDLNGSELILDADGDTSITADTDDQIDVKIGGADDFQFTANTFTALSGSSIATNTITETTATSGVTIDGALIKDGAVPTRETVTAASGDGAISVKEGIVIITKATAAALTLADPTAGTDDGKVLKIYSATAAAHTVDNSAGSGFNAGGTGADVGTFGGAKGDGMELVAYNGDWYTTQLRNVTLS